MATPEDNDEPPEAPAGEPARTDAGPDPVWGLGVFIVGLFVMALGGAQTWHWVFNIGETLLLIGAIVFLVCMTMTALKQQPLDWRKALRSALRGKDEE